MKKGKGPKTIIIGAGKLAWHLGPALQKAGFRIIQVYSRTLSSAAAFGLHIDVPWTTDVNMLKEDADLVIFCLTDRALEALLPQIADRRPRDRWVAGGSRDAQSRALAKANEILHRDNPALLSPEVDDAIRSRFQSALGECGEG